MVTRIEKLQQIIEIAKEPKAIQLPPIIYGLDTILGGALYAHVRDEIGPSGVIYIADKDYIECTITMMSRILAVDPTNKIQYIMDGTAGKDDFDCDGFALRLAGNLSIPGYEDLAFGLAWSNTHAFNVFWNGKRLMRIEPQNDGMVLYERKDGMYYPIRFIMI